MAKKKAVFRPKKKKLSVAEIAAMLLQCLGEAKGKYKTADAARVVLESKLKAGQIVTLPSSDWLSPELRGKRYRWVDKGSSFAVGQTARRFDLKPA